MSVLFVGIELSIFEFLFIRDIGLQFLSLLLWL